MYIAFPPNFSFSRYDTKLRRDKKGKHNLSLVAFTSARGIEIRETEGHADGERRANHDIVLEGVITLDVRTDLVPQPPIHKFYQVHCTRFPTLSLFLYLPILSIADISEASPESFRVFFFFSTRCSASGVQGA
jgi:hypothetical protein